ncbi:uncharacterized protein LOC124249879 isoform X2 [Equus quagga]|uniref:uncharacterized protein LOC124249879 isoform X2 n=1 Tax=Equus quagga TaxID=89248 RepID=UPI001EE28FE6|nr:uncharacterized protein LOC124249879 isoform X2 [Equus quagga]
MVVDSGFCEQFPHVSRQPAPVDSSLGSLVPSPEGVSQTLCLDKPSPDGLALAPAPPSRYYLLSEAVLDQSTQDVNPWPKCHSHLLRQHRPAHSGTRAPRGQRTDGPQVPPPQTERVHAKNEFSKVIVTTLAHSSGCHIHVAQANLVYAVIFRVEGLDLLGPQRWSPGPGGRQGRPGLGPPPGKPPPGLNRSVTTPGRGQRFGASFHTL